MSTWHIEIDRKPACENIDYIKLQKPCEFEINELDVTRINATILAIENLFASSSISIVKGKCPHTYPKNLKDLVI
jgi:hypothetical protein